MSLIPKKIYQSWKTKNLPEKMAQIVNRTKELNADYDYELWDDKECRQFLLDNFGQNYANAFDILIPGAFKCDFWRYAVLYINGGVYMDIDMVPSLPFREILRDNDQFVSIVDRKFIFKPKSDIYQAFIACRPKHPIMLMSLELAFYNIASRKHDLFDDLGITGPVVVGIALNLYWKNRKTLGNIIPGEYSDGIRLLEMDLKHTWDNTGKTIFDNRFEGYKRGTTNYGRIDSFYSDDPMKGKRMLIKYGIWLLIILALVGLIFALIFRKKLKDCENGKKQNTI
jgi:hypothetical protein